MMKPTEHRPNISSVMKPHSIVESEYQGRKQDRKVYRTQHFGNQVINPAIQPKNALTIK